MDLELLDTSCVYILVPTHLNIQIKYKTIPNLNNLPKCQKPWSHGTTLRLDVLTNETLIQWIVSKYDIVLSTKRHELTSDRDYNRNSEAIITAYIV